MENQAHHRDRLDASFCVMSLFLHESKCSFFLTDPRECEGYLYPPKKKLWRRPSVKKLAFFQKVGLFSWTPSRQTLIRLEQTGCPGYCAEWNSLWGYCVAENERFYGTKIPPTSRAQRERFPVRIVMHIP